MIFISLSGSFLHFTFELLNRFWLAGVFSAVNESTWEHLKLAVFPAILWLILEKKVFRLKADNFLFAKAVGTYLMPVLIILFFYSYKAILGHNLLVIDISLFFVSAILGQIASYKIMCRPEFAGKFGRISFLALTILALAFVVFTFYPPHLFIFNDPIYGQYGIIK